MRTFKLWLEPDKSFPRFKRLAFEEVEVPIDDVLQQGIHPWQGPGKCYSLRDRFMDLLNAPAAMPGELEESGFSFQVSSGGMASPAYNAYYAQYCREFTFEDALRRVRERVYFVAQLTFRELAEIARWHLQATWSQSVARQLLGDAHPVFDEMRRFLKAKDNTLKISSYADVDTLDLSTLLSLEDFASEDRLLIQQALPSCNFRQESFLTQVTDPRGRLRMIERIPNFQLQVRPLAANGMRQALLYNCACSGEKVRFIPEMSASTCHRAAARSYSDRWRLDAGRYCFTASLGHLTEMIDEPDSEISFPTLAYGRHKSAIVSEGRMREARPKVYRPGGILRSGSPGDAFKEVLRQFGVSMTGRKSELVEKLARLSAEVYAKEASRLDAYFRANRFVRVKNPATAIYADFPILEEDGLRDMLLQMYILKHLRGNAILEGAHENDTFDLLSLARALIAGEVEITGGFLRVEETKSDASGERQITDPEKGAER